MSLAKNRSGDEFANNLGPASPKAALKTPPCSESYAVASSGLTLRTVGCSCSVVQFGCFLCSRFTAWLNSTPADPGNFLSLVCALPELPQGFRQSVLVGDIPGDVDKSPVDAHDLIACHEPNQVLENQSSKGCVARHTVPGCAGVGLGAGSCSTSPGCG